MKSVLYCESLFRGRSENRSQCSLKMWDTKKALLLSGVGIGLAASTAILYALYKKDDDSLDDFKIFGNTTITSRHSVIRVPVPNDVVGAVIGRQGAVIKQIQSQTHTRINFEDKIDVPDNEGVRIAVIRGSPEDVQEAENIIQSIIADQPVLITEVIYVPQKACGRIIGKNGDTIRYLCQVSHAKIVVERNNSDGLQRVTITGTKEEIECAQQLIDEKVAEEEAFRQKVDLSSSGRVILYKGRQLSIEGQNVKNEMESDESRMQETLVPTASDGFIESYVSSVTSPSRFWVQLVGTKSIQLDRMVEEMTSFYNAPATRDMLCASNLKVGDVVAAPFTLDNAWYRARVISIEEDAYSEDEAKVTVYYVDFGDEGQVLCKDICTLSQEYMVIPFQAIECSLAYVEPLDGDWSDEATDLFGQITHVAQWKVLMCKPVDCIKKENSNSMVYSVELVDTNSSQDVNIAEQLVKKGFAVWDKTKLKKLISK